MDGLEPAKHTRLIMMGEAALCNGFSLLGFETWPDASAEELEGLLEQLQQDGETALVFLDPQLARCECKALKRLQYHGGGILVTEIPPLNAPGSYRPQVEELVVSVLGKGALE
ncbi:V-type ATP synthase subunit F [Thiolapillus sp.]